MAVEDRGGMGSSKVTQVAHPKEERPPKNPEPTPGVKRAAGAPLEGPRLKKPQIRQALAPR